MGCRLCGFPELHPQFGFSKVEVFLPECATTTAAYSVPAKPPRRVLALSSSAAEVLRRAASERRQNRLSDAF